MFDYIELETLKSSLFAIIVLFVTNATFYHKKRIRFSLIFILIVVFILLLPLIEASIASSNARDNITAFVNSKVLECKDAKSSYRVSKKDGWSVEGDSFFKESLLIRTDRCKKRQGE